MKITIAKDAGYCFGVRDAVNMAYDAADKYGTVNMLGSIVHNENVVDDLENSGAHIIENIDDFPGDTPILFRAHGTVNKLWDKAKEKEFNIIDATCPLVYEIHHEVKNLSKDNRQIIIIGDHGHDEVIAIADQVKDARIVSNRDEALKLRKIKRAGVVCQSTQDIENVQDIVAVLMTKVFDLKIINTICYPTKRNHEQLEEIAATHDIVIIIGSYTSANSKRLTLLAKKLNNKVHQVNCADELEEKWFNNIDSVGISAGASTPDYLIKEVRNKIEKYEV